VHGGADATERLSSDPVGATLHARARAATTEAATTEASGVWGCLAASASAPPLLHVDTAMLLALDHSGGAGTYVAVVQDDKAWVEYTPPASSTGGSSAPRVCDVRRAPLTARDALATRYLRMRHHLRNFSAGVDVRVAKVVQDAEDHSNQVNCRREDAEIASLARNAAFSAWVRRLARRPLGAFPLSESAAAGGRTRGTVARALQSLRPKPAFIVINPKIPPKILTILTLPDLHQQQTQTQRGSRCGGRGGRGGVRDGRAGRVINSGGGDTGTRVDRRVAKGLPAGARAAFTAVEQGETPDDVALFDDYEEDDVPPPIASTPSVAPGSGSGGGGKPMVAGTLAAVLKEHQWEGVRFLWRHVVEGHEYQLEREKEADARAVRETAAGGAAAGQGASKGKGRPHNDNDGDQEELPGCILAHSMGLGKTLQTITLLHTLSTRDDARDQHTRALLVVPANVICSWNAEFDKWLPPVGVGGSGASTRVGLTFDSVYTLGLNDDPINAKERDAQRAATVEAWHKSKHGVLLMTFDLFTNYINSEGMLKAGRHTVVAGAPDSVDSAVAAVAAAKMVAAEALVAAAEIRAMSVHDLKRLLKSRDVSIHGVSEKHELVDLALLGAGGGGGATGANVAGMMQAPLLDTAGDGGRGEEGTEPPPAGEAGEANATAAAATDEAAVRAACVKMLKEGAAIVVVDEAHEIKNEKSYRAKALQCIVTTRRIALTGYPLQNNIYEYYSMINFVAPGILGDLKCFRDRFGVAITNGFAEGATPQQRGAMRRKLSALKDVAVWVV